MKKVIILFVTFFSFVLNVKPVNASDNQFITIVNPIRISSYTFDPLKSISAQYKVISKNNLSATWLITFDVLDKAELTKFIKTFDTDQEIGLFFEVSKNYANASGVMYDDNKSWHHASNIFLSGYSQEDRKKLIDVLFSKFKETFGYYPNSVGSWWTDAYSLNYMKEKYDITTNLTVADQNSTDGYQVWGQYFSTPFYPSKYHVGMPASENNKLDIVMMQWAPRFPYEGYFNSLYSSQDYKVVKEINSISYYEKLIKFYADKHSNKFGQAVVGLEGDFNPNDYAGSYKDEMEVVSKLIKDGNYSVITMDGFSKWYRNEFKELSPVQIHSSESVKDPDRKVWWYQSPEYRIGITYKNGVLKIFDLRKYSDNFEEPYFIAPNRNINLQIHIPSIIDEVNNPSNTWEIQVGKFVDVTSSDQKLQLSFSHGKVTFNSDNFEVDKVFAIPDSIKKYKGFNIFHDNNFSIINFNNHLEIGPDGYIFTGLTEGGLRELQRKRTLLLVTILIISYGMFIRYLYFTNINIFTKIAISLFPIFITTIYGYYWTLGNSNRYYVSQSEIDALMYLNSLPNGAILTYDKECLGCNYGSKIKPAVFANRRDYVNKFSNKKVIKKNEIFDINDRQKAKHLFDSSEVKYIYLVSYDSYTEKIPFSPGDLGIEKIYSNANSEIWMRKD